MRPARNAPGLRETSSCVQLSAADTVKQVVMTAATTGSLVVRCISAGLKALGPEGVSGVAAKDRTRLRDTSNWGLTQGIRKYGKLPRQWIDQYLERERTYSRMGTRKPGGPLSGIDPKMINPKEISTAHLQRTAHR